jgi:hypothetical protein
MQRHENEHDDPDFELFHSAGSNLDIQDCCDCSSIAVWPHPLGSPEDGWKGLKAPCYLVAALSMRVFLNSASGLGPSQERGPSWHVHHHLNLKTLMLLFLIRNIIFPLRREWLAA